MLYLGCPVWLSGCCYLAAQEFWIVVRVMLYLGCLGWLSGHYYSVSQVCIVVRVTLCLGCLDGCQVVAMLSE